MLTLQRYFFATLLLCCSLHAQTAAERAQQAGELVTLKGHRVLRLFGKEIGERGFAHGYLLAQDVIDDAEATLKSLPNFNSEKYTSRLLPWANAKFDWDADAKAELDGIFAGISARLGEDGMLVKSLGRKLTREDLNAINVIADYFGPACSGFAVWNDRAAGGEVLHGRTLDFPIGPKAIADQVIVVSEALPERGADPERKAWVAVGWPGLISQYSGMNADGVVVCIHDGYNTRKGDKGTGYVPRGLLIRRVLEGVDVSAGDPAAQGAKITSAKPSACGNLFHMTWPKAVAEKAKTTPSAVLEFDPADQETVIRRMDASNALVLTNHFCLRCAPRDCERFKNISKGLTLLNDAKKPVGLMEARKLMMSAEQPVAAHTLYFQPDSLQINVALTHNAVMSPRVAPTQFTFKELFERSGK